MKMTDLAGVGPKTAALFSKLNINSPNELLEHYPRYYDEYKMPVSISEAEVGITNAVKGTVIRNPDIRSYNRKTVVTAYIRDENGMNMKVVWFNSPYIRSIIHMGDVRIFRGVLKYEHGSFSMAQPKFYKENDYEKLSGSMFPVYSLTEGLTNQTVVKAVKSAFEKCEIKEIIPKSVREKYNLEKRANALYFVHFPKDRDSLDKARRTLIFSEFFTFIYSLRNAKDRSDKAKNDHIIAMPLEVSNLISNLPYELTTGQKEAINDIFNDMHSENVMNRLLQGDVGSGKTIVAFIAMISTVLCGYQCALMAPTEVLAKQHYDDLTKLLSDNNLDIDVEFLSGSLTAAKKREAKTRIESGQSRIVIGTHAIIQEDVLFENLALVITDEQHRFGVRQRENISGKGNSTHVLVMSATPIPRTLALIMYGDLDISVIKELPKGRKKIANCVVDHSYMDKVYSFITKEIGLGHQVYVICPSVEYSEALEGENVIEYTQKLKDIFGNKYRIEYLHGRMKPLEKNEIMQRFADGNIDILVSTTVVEVGVNVPNATLMIIENAERFGLSQLHQLRGRIGRGDSRSYCIFINGSKSENAKRRLDIINSSTDGFFIASNDLKLRGPGELFGVRQSGEFQFALGDIYDNSEILTRSYEAVISVENGELEISDDERIIIRGFADANINL